MKKIVCPLLVFLVLGALLHGQTLDDVLAMNYRAHGGLDKMKAIVGCKMSGTITAAAQGLELPVVIWQKLPDRMRVETSFQDKKIVQAFDGRTAWWIMPFLSEEAQAMPPEQGKLFREQADFENPLVVFREKGYSLELLGKEEMEGRPVFKLKLKKNDGREIYYFLDAESGIELKSSLLMKMGESEGLVEIFYGDYRPIGGHVQPFAVENKLNGQSQMQMTFEAVEINPDMEDDLFAMPDKKDASAKKETPDKKDAPAKKEAPGKKGRK